MHDIFLSYAREDYDRAARLVDTLQNRGWSVFWDQRIPVGRTWRDTIGEELASATRVIVLWTTNSIDSDWVIQEADEAKRLKKLVPAIFDHVQPPLGFRGLQAVDLTQWDVAGDVTSVNLLLADIDDILSNAQSRSDSLDQVHGEGGSLKDVALAAPQSLPALHFNRRHALVGAASLSIVSIGGGVAYWARLRNDVTADKTRSIHANTQRRIAFLFGQSRYLHVPPLPNPINDCELLADKLDALGFVIMRHLDLDTTGLLTRLCDIVKSIRGADIVLFYYSGHGMEIGGVPYIFPVEAEVGAQYDVGTRAISLDEFFRRLRHVSRITLALFDACRDNPFGSTPSPSARGISFGDETVLERPVPAPPPAFEPKEEDAPEVLPDDAGPSAADLDSLSHVCFDYKPDSPLGGIAIVFATDKGQVAFDGEGVNSPFAIAVAEAISTPGLELYQVLKRVRRTVLQATHGRQEPWISWSLDEEFYFMPADS